MSCRENLLPILPQSLYVADGISNTQEKIGVQEPSAVQRDLPAAVFLAKRPGNPAYQWLILLTSGYIETNPGPIRWPSGKCGRSATFDSIRCGDCRQWTHRTCLGLSQKELRVGTLALALRVQRRNLRHQQPLWLQQPQRRPAPEKMRILQINMNGWRSKAAILDNLAGETNTDVICIQETKLSDEDATKYPGSNWTKFLFSRNVQSRGGKHMPRRHSHPGQTWSQVFQVTGDSSSR